MNRGEPIYLDCAASAPPHPKVVELMVRHLTSEFGNAGSYTHQFGTKARKSLEHARDQIAAAISARRSEVFFTSGATEANNLSITGIVDGMNQGHIVTTAIEHPAVLEPLRNLQARGFEITQIQPTSGGWIHAGELLAAVRPDTCLVSMMQINNETGVAQPIEEVADSLGSAKAAFHVDASQGFGKILGPLRHPRIDMMSLSAHKMGGPQGVGALIVRRRLRPFLKPLMFGGGQEGGLRPGTVPVHLAAGFGLAAELAVNESAAWNEAAARYQRRILDGLRPVGPVVNGDLDRLSPYMLNVSFPGLDNQQVTEAWSTLAAVSNGSACTSQQVHCSHVLHAMGFNDERAFSAVRLSWNQQTELPDLAAMVKALQRLPREAHGGVS